MHDDPRESRLADIVEHGDDPCCIAWKNGGQNLRGAARSKVVQLVLPCALGSRAAEDADELLKKKIRKRAWFAGIGTRISPTSMMQFSTRVGSKKSDGTSWGASSRH